MIKPCLWFDSEAEAAANFYVSIFKDGRILTTARYPEAGQEIHGRQAGSVMVVEFEVNGMRFTALNAGPHFKFNEAVSFQIMCSTQEEVDYYWDRLTEGGDPKAQQCGWLKDRFGLSWQVVPEGMEKMLSSADRAAANRAMAAVLQMKKLDMNELQRVYEGESCASG